MKKLFKTLALCAMALATLSACEEDPTTKPQPDDTENTEKPGTGENPGDEEPGTGENPDDEKPGTGDSTSPLTPDEHKAKLEDIAIELLDEFDPADFEALIKSLSYFEEFFEAEDEWVEGPIEEDMPVKPGDEDEYIEDMTRALKSFSVAGLVDAVTRASEDIILDVNDEDFDFNGVIITFDEEGEPIFDENGNPGECKVMWEDSVATFTWGESKSEYTYYDEEAEANIVVRIPETINLSLTINGVEHLNVSVAPSIANGTYTANVAIKLNGGYEINSQEEADDTKVSCSYSLSKSGKKLSGATATVSVNGLTNPDNLYGEYFFKEVTNGSIQIDILTLSLIAAGDFTGMYDKMEEINDKYNWWDDEGNYIEAQEKAFYEEMCDLINDTVEFVAIYNDTNEKIADVKAQPRRSVYIEGDTEDIDYEIDMVLVFPDDSKFVVQDYFTADSFEGLLEYISENFGE